MKHPQHVWFAVDFDGEEWMYAQCPKKQENTNRWVCNNNKGGTYGACGLPDGTIQHITGKNLTWNDKPLKWKP